MGVIGVYYLVYSPIGTTSAYSEVKVSGGRRTANSMTKKLPHRRKGANPEVARQATDALGGYAYQLDHTVFRWLSLNDDEVMHIEFAEDIAVSEDGALDLTQIKKLKANITIRSDGVAKLITSVWTFQQDNPGRQVSGAMLTTSGIGKEKGMTFPGGVPGLDLLAHSRPCRRGCRPDPHCAALSRSQ